MLNMICADCSHASCHSPSIIRSAVIKLRRVSRNPYLREPFNLQGFLSFVHRIYVPNHNNARHKILKARHSSSLAGHPGITKTMKLISRDYVLNGLRKDVEAYVTGCATCQRTKVSHQRSHPLLRPLPVPKVTWKHLSMDFIKPFPGSAQPLYRLSPSCRRSNRRVNQVLEQYLRVFTSHHQDDWHRLLPQASFHYNNSLHSVIYLTPFFANFGYHPRCIQELQSTTTSADVPDAVHVAVSLLDLHRFCADDIATVVPTSGTSLHQSQPGPKPPPSASLRSVPYSRQNLRSRVSNELPLDWRIFDIFHVSLLRLFTPPLFDSQAPTSSPLIELSEDISIPIHQVANILDSLNYSSTGKLEYLVEWAGGREETNEQISWQLPSDLNR